MALIDSNILIYAARKNSREHERAIQLLKKSAEGPEVWHLAWQNIFEFIRVVTDAARSADKPLYIDEALERTRSILSSPSLQIIHPGPKHFEIFSEIASHTPAVRGIFVHDARLAAIMIENDVRKIYTADDGFRKFKNIEVIDPFK